MARNISKETKQKILELYQQGWTTAAIAKELGVAKSTVTRNTLKAGLRAKHDVAGKRLSPKEIAEIKSLYQNTLLPLEEIKRRLGVSLDSIYYHTEGLSRQIPQDTLQELISLYLNGQITAQKVKELTGMTKTQFYAEVSKVVRDHVKGD